jgi:hypothetical protein
MRSPALAAGIAAIVLSGGTVAQDASTTRYSVPGHGSLELKVPGGWRSQTRSRSEPPIAQVRLTPASGNAFDLQITAGWLDPAKSDRRPDALKARVQSAANAALKEAVEKEVKVLELRGAQSQGYYFLLTDKAPGPGEFKYLTQGMLSVGELTVAFTILHREAASDDREKALRVVADAVQSKTEVPAAAAPATDSSEKLRIAEREKVYELTVPVSKLVMTIPKAGLTQTPVGSHPRYFQLTGSVIVSGWFEAADGFKGISEFWKGESEGLKRQGMTVVNVEFTKVGNWEVVLYDLPTKVATFANLRASWVQAGTWIDLHLSVPKPGADDRAKMLEMLRAIEVRERQ